MSDIFYIVNPAGHGGAGTQAREEFKKLWPDEINAGDVQITERAGHATEIAFSRKDRE